MAKRQFNPKINTNVNANVHARLHDQMNVPINFVAEAATDWLQVDVIRSFFFRIGWHCIHLRERLTPEAYRALLIVVFHGLNS